MPSSLEASALAVRRRPGMFVGALDGRGIAEVALGFVAHSLEEHFFGYGNRIAVEAGEGSLSVRDEGRGLQARPGLLAALTALQAGERFSEG
jgi:DNA gyrase/topoisomerase IV subunit B